MHTIQVFYELDCGKPKSSRDDLKQANNRHTYRNGEQGQTTSTKIKQKLSLLIAQRMLIIGQRNYLHTHDL